VKPQERVNAILKSRLEPSARLLLVSIASHMSDGNLQTWISPDTMTEETGLSRSTVMSLLASLTAAGVLTRTEEGHRAKTTRIMWEGLQEYRPAASKRGGTRVQSDNRTVESDNRTHADDCANPVQGSEHRTEGSDNRTEASEHRTPNRPIIGPDPTMNRPTIRPMDPTSTYVVQPPPVRPAGPALFPTPPAAEDTVSTPKPDALTPGELAVWQAYRLHHPTAKATPPKAHQGLLRAAVAEHGAEAVVAVVRWAHQSEHERARYLRDGGYTGLDNLLRREKLPARIELAAKEEAGEVPKPKLSALPPGMKPRGPVVIDAESGRVEVQPEPRKGGKPDLFDMADWLKTIDVSAEGREGEEDHAQGN